MAQATSLPIVRFDLEASVEKFEGSERLVWLTRKKSPEQAEPALISPGDPYRTELRRGSGKPIQNGNHVVQGEDLGVTDAKDARIRCIQRFIPRNSTVRDTFEKGGRLSRSPRRRQVRH